MISRFESSMQTEMCQTQQNPTDIRLVADRGSDVGEVCLGELPVMLGRCAEAGIQVCDRWVSRRHCEVDLVSGELVIRDLGARHGTYVNGERVTEIRLCPGDEICIGLTRLTVVS